jgi:hypothetical protein
MSVNPLELYNKNWLDDEKMLIMDGLEKEKKINSSSSSDGEKTV